MGTKKDRRSIAEKDKCYVWHPFTQMKDWLQADILVIERAEGHYLYDTEGTRYIDGVSSLWTNVHGHQVKHIDDAVKDQLGMVAHSTFLGLSNVPATLLAEKLVALAPEGLCKVFYADSGSEAVEVALKVAYQYWCQKENPQPEKKKFLHLAESYHGDTLGSVSVGGIDLFHEIYRPFLFDTIAAPTPYCYRCPLGKEKGQCAEECLCRLEELVARHAHELAGVIVEPLMQGAAGMIMQPKGFLARLRACTREHNVLLICDEVATGFGRTGTMFACEHEQVSPDILTLGKGITGGYLPLSATLFTQEIFNAFLGEQHEYKTFFHGHTYTGNQLCARAAVANLEVFEHEQVLTKLKPKIERMATGLTRIAELSHVGDVRQVGMMVGIELVKDRATKESYPTEEKIGIQVITEARRQGVIIRPLGNVIVLMPQLSISEDALQTLLNVTHDAIQSVTNAVQ